MTRLILFTIPVLVPMMLSSCSPSSDSGNAGPGDLDKLGTAELRVKELSVRAWIADEIDEQTKGLMFVTAEEMPPYEDGALRGMIFVYDFDHQGGFWMRNTIIDLDIAYIDKDGKIVQIFTMAALDERSYIPRSQYRYALEVTAGVFAQQGITEGDTVSIPESILKPAQ